MNLVVGAEEGHEHKTFDWSLKELTDREFSLTLQCNHIMSISSGSVDTLYIEFHNADTFLIPQNDLEPVPDGYQVVVPLPTQSPSVLSQD